ncbi:hypothetical protein ACQ4PT_069408 [Festuca glaucescens]
MEESISSSKTAGASFSCYDVHRCYASGGPHASSEASEDSGWTAYFYDDDGEQLQASEEESAPALPAPRKKKANWHGHGHGDRASTSTVSTASKTKARVKKAGAEEEKKKRPRCCWEPADEDPLQDTASSLPANATRQVQLQDGSQIAGCYDQRRSSDTALQWIDYRSLQETHMGLPGQARCRKEGLVPLKLFVEQHYLQ